MNKSKLYKINHNSMLVSAIAVSVGLFIKIAYDFLVPHLTPSKLEQNKNAPLVAWLWPVSNRYFKARSLIISIAFDLYI